MARLANSGQLGFTSGSYINFQTSCIGSVIKGSENSNYTIARFGEMFNGRQVIPAVVVKITETLNTSTEMTLWNMFFFPEKINYM